MEAVNDYYNGHTFVPTKPVKVKKNQRAIVTILDDIIERDDKSNTKISRDRILELKKTSTSVKLTGAIPHAPITIEEIREERLTDKYGSID
jgi:hypothetical protein